MVAELLSTLRLVLAEAPWLSPYGGPDEDQDELLQLINDVMTSWWVQAIAIALWAIVAVLLFWSLRREDTGERTVSRRQATVATLGFLIALGAIVVLAATNRAPAFIIVEFLMLFAVLMYLVVRNLAPAVLGTGAAIMWVVSPKRRREMREEAEGRAGAQERGAALERTLDGALDEAHDASHVPSPPA